MGIKVFPNPAADKLFVAPRRQNCMLRVVDVAGRTLLTSRIDDADNLVDISALKNGVYLVVVNGEGQQWVEKLIVRR